MFPKLIKLLIKSRFSWTYFLIIFLFLFYGVMAIMLSSVPTGQDYADYYFAGIFGLFSAVSIMLGGLSMTQSDHEFLLVSAVSRRDLSVALYIAQYVYTGPIIFIAFLLYGFTADYSGLDKVLIFFDALMMSTVPVSLTVASTNIDLKLRLAGAAAFMVWVFSFKLGFIYSPISMFQGHILEAVLPTMAISAIFLFVALRLLRSKNLAYRISNIRIRGSEYRNIRRYVNLSPWRAIFRYGFSQFEITTRTNFSGTPTLSGRRIRANFVLIFFIAAAIVYGYVAYSFNPSGNTIGDINFATFLGGMYVGVLPPLMMSGSTMPMERAWLSFTSMTPDKYVPLLTVAKVVQLLYLMAAFIIVDIILFFYGVKGSLNNLILFSVFDPFFLILFMAINYRVQNYQIRDEQLISSRYTASQFALVLPSLGFFAIAAISNILLVADLVIVPVVAALGIWVLFWKKFWNKRLNKLIEAGFI